MYLCKLPLTFWKTSKSISDPGVSPHRDLRVMQGQGHPRWRSRYPPEYLLLQRPHMPYTTGLDTLHVTWLRTPWCGCPCMTRGSRCDDPPGPWRVRISLWCFSECKMPVAQINQCFLCILHLEWCSLLVCVLDTEIPSSSRSCLLAAIAAFLGVPQCHYHPVITLDILFLLPLCHLLLAMF